MSTTTQKKTTTSVANNGQTSAQTPATAAPAQTDGRVTADSIKNVYSQMQEQANKQVDHSVQAGVAELERAQADAQKQFRTQQSQVNIQEAQARDQQALYAAARGDRGGITARQYNSIANTAANNRRAIEQQRQQLATDTARQIADLRAQGEFEKANSVLQIAQQQLAQLWELQQYEDQQAQIQKEFDYQVSQDMLAQDNYLQQFDYQKQQDQQAQQNYQQEWDYQVQQDQMDREYQAQVDAYNRAQLEKEWAYQQQQDQLAQQNYEKEWAYQQQQDQLAQQNYRQEWAYQQQQDQLAQQNYEKEWAYQQQQGTYTMGQTEREWAYEIAMQAIKTGVVPPASVLTAAGLDNKTATAMASVYKAAASGSDSGSSSADDYEYEVEEPVTGSTGSTGSTGGVATDNTGANGLLAGLGMYNPNAKPAQQPETPATNTKTGTVTTNSKSLNMRSGAGTGNSVVTAIPKGAKVTVLGESNGWYQVQYNGKTGWVSSQYLTVGGTGNSSSSSTTATILPMDQVITDIEALIAGGANRAEIMTLLKGAYEDGSLDEGTYDTLIERYVTEYYN